VQRNERPVTKHSSAVLFIFVGCLNVLHTCLFFSHDNIKVFIWQPSPNKNQSSIFNYKNNNHKHQQWRRDFPGRKWK